MYVALRETFDVYPDNKAVRRYPGDRLETFLTWPLQNQMAALNTRMVREVPDEGIEMDQLYARQHRAEVEEAKARARQAAADVVEPGFAPEPEPATSAAPRVKHSCEHCDFVGATARGLAIHAGSAHKDA